MAQDPFPDACDQEESGAPDALDPWAEKEPVFGQAERRHALSGSPGTPPIGNLAIRPNTSAFQNVEELDSLHETIRVEIETVGTGKWLCGLCERASRRTVEVSLRSAVWHGFALPETGAHVRVLVAPRMTPPFSVSARVVPASKQQGGAGAFKVMLALDTHDPVVLTKWQSALERARAI